MKISSKDWWVKVLGMCQHNWALIESNEKITAYFFHDNGVNVSPPEKLKYFEVKNKSGIVDSLIFDNKLSAEKALKKNGFMRLSENSGPWELNIPPHDFYDAREDNSGIYNKDGHWIS
jgi:hypothetical protein